ncbi:MAG: hypothetical protein GWO22_28225, partial [Actinobacteria bacterium]|nr:hypothetical protein [Actinomycetota bacterium]
MQRQGGEGTGEGAAREAIPEDAGVIDEATKEIRYPTLKLANFKAEGHRATQYGAHTVKRARTFARGNPDQ